MRQAGAVVPGFLRCRTADHRPGCQARNMFVSLIIQVDQVGPDQDPGGCTRLRHFLHPRKRGPGRKCVTGSDGPEPLPSGPCIEDRDSPQTGKTAADKDRADAALQQGRRDQASIRTRRCIGRIRPEGIGIPQGPGKAPDRIVRHGLIVESPARPVTVILTVDPVHWHDCPDPPVLLLQKGIDPLIPFL